MSDRPTPETDAMYETFNQSGSFPLRAVNFARNLERQRDEAIRVIRIYHGDMQHLGYWIPDPLRKIVESAIADKTKGAQE